VLSTLFYGAGAAHAVDYVSVGGSSAILYDAPSNKAKKLFVVNRYMPFEQVVVLDKWVKVRDRSGAVLGGKAGVDQQALCICVVATAGCARRTRPWCGAPVPGAAASSTGAHRVNGRGWVKVRHQDGEVGYVRSTEVWAIDRQISTQGAIHRALIFDTSIDPGATNCAAAI